MHLKATTRTLAGLLIICIGTAINTNAQNSINQIHGPQEVLLKSTINTGIDSADIAKSTAMSTSGVANVLAKYGKANQLYYKMIDSLSKVIFQNPAEDSAGLQYSTEWVGTPNMGLRRPNYVVIHYTANNSVDETLKAFSTPGGREASAHYVIGKDGTIYHMLNDLLRSHHAGDSKWGNNTDLNSSSIGIELDNNGYQPYPEAQLNSLLALLDKLKDTYKIPTANFLGHGDVAPTRKIDPGTKFPWQTLAQKGFGMWYGDTANVKVPETFDHMMALRIIGYDISSPAQAVSAFKRHFMADNSSTMSDDVRKLIYMVYLKAQ
jgi:N-acetylmuramoyl-L-alanine amidase